MIIIYSFIFRDTLINEEIIVDEFPKKELGTMDIKVVNAGTKKLISEFHLPISKQLPLFHQISLAFQSSLDIGMQISLVKTNDHVVDFKDLQREYNTKMVFLNTQMMSLKESLPLPMQCVAVMRIIHKASEYMERMETNQRRFEVHMSLTFYVRKDIQ